MSNSDSNEENVPTRMPKAVKSTQPTTNRPKTSAMVLDAISELNDRGGSSVQAIQKYIAATYTVDPKTIGMHVKKYLKKAVLDGELIQTKGKGAIGSFKMATKPKAKPKKSPTKKDVTAKKPHTNGPTKTAATKVVIKKPKVAGTTNVVKVAKSSANIKSSAPKANTVKSAKPSTSKVKTQK